MIEDEAARARVGSVLNEKWTLEKLLGVGGMGAVYAARHTRNAGRAAVKVLHPELARFDEVRQRFLREGRAANTVQHPGVVTVIDDDEVESGPDAGTAYLVMDLLDGESLEDRIERGPKVGERELLTILDAVLDVLAAAHRHGVVHRDLKPENLFFAKDAMSGSARWMVLDFGLARLLDASVITRYGMAVGTPAYMSPEQAAGRRDEIDGRTDLFALAATAFRVLTGRRVHEGASALDVVLKMASIPAPMIQHIAPEVSDGVARVIDCALAFHRDDRYPDAAAMRVDVLETLAAFDARAKAEASKGAKPPKLSKPAKAEMGPKPPGPAKTETAPKPSRPAKTETTTATKTVLEVDAATIVAVPDPPRRAPRAEATMEISASELRPATRAELAAPMRPIARSETQRPQTRPEPIRPTARSEAQRPPLPSGLGAQARAKARSEAQIPEVSAQLAPEETAPPLPKRSPPPVPRRKRPSLIPIVTALFLGGLVVKLALDAEDARRGANAPPIASASTSTSTSTSVGTTPSEPGSTHGSGVPIELVDAEGARALASGVSTAPDDGGDDDEDDGGEEPTQMIEVGSFDAGRAERRGLDAGAKGASERRSLVSAGSGHPAAPPPYHRPNHGKHRPKRPD